MQNFAWTPLRQTCRDIPHFFRRTNGLYTTSLRLKSTKVDTQLNWVKYFEIRRRRRQWQTVRIKLLLRPFSRHHNDQALTIPCAMIGFFGGSFYFGSLQTDPTKPIMACLQLTVLSKDLNYSTGHRSNDVLWRLYCALHG